jgi:hypothetical protein
MRPLTTDTQLPALKVSDTASKRLVTPAVAHNDKKDAQALLEAQEAVLDAQARPYGEATALLRGEFYFLERNSGSLIGVPTGFVPRATAPVGSYYHEAMSALLGHVLEGTYAGLFTWADMAEPVLALERDLLKWAFMSVKRREIVVQSLQDQLNTLIESGVRCATLEDATGREVLSLAYYRREEYTFSAWVEGMSTGERPIPLPILAAIALSHRDYATSEQVIRFLQTQMAITEYRKD